MPFEIKSIYGLKNETDTGAAVKDEGEIATGVQDDGEGQDCLICLSEPKDTLIMPCGHLCVCADCGRSLINKKYTCPVCRGTIGSLIPFKQQSVNKKRV